MDYGARWYDASIARWSAVDPMAEKYYEWSGYNYVLNNPLILIDPDGKAPQDIIVGKEDQNLVLENLHARTKARYTFNEDNELIRDESVKQESDAYSDKIDEAIASDNKMIIQKKQDVYKSDWGIEVSIDVFYGGGVTQDGEEAYFDKDAKLGDEPKTRRVATVYITGNPNEEVFDKEGDKLDYTSADILLHEIIGHAMSILGFSGTGNAVDNENQVRKELGLKERQRDEDHPE